MSVARIPRLDGPQDAPAGPAEPPGVLVPPALAGPLLRVLMRALTREQREDGGVVPPGIAEFLSALAALADNPTPAGAPGSGDGTNSGGPATVEVSAATAAEAIGASPEYVRRLCRTGRLPARRIGRNWLITLEANHLAQDDHPPPCSADTRDSARRAG